MKEELSEAGKRANMEYYDSLSCKHGYLSLVNMEKARKMAQTMKTQGTISQPPDQEP